MGYDLDEVANIEEEITGINGKTFKIFMLTIRQRLELDKILQTVEKKVYKILKPSLWSKIVNKILRKGQVNIFNGQKEHDDFLFIKASLDFCNPKQPFTQEDWISMTTARSARLLEIVMEKNYFFELDKLVREAEKIKK